MRIAMYCGAPTAATVFALTAPRARSVLLAAPKLQNDPTFDEPIPRRIRWLPLKPPSACVIGWRRYQPTMLKLPAAGAALSSVQPIGELPRLAFVGAFGSESKFWE